jgi:hypothetical protein
VETPAFFEVRTEFLNVNLDDLHGVTYCTPLDLKLVVSRQLCASLVAFPRLHFSLLWFRGTTGCGLRATSYAAVADRPVSPYIAFKIRWAAFSFHFRSET